MFISPKATEIFLCGVIKLFSFAVSNKFDYQPLPSKRWAGRMSNMGYLTPALLYLFNFSRNACINRIHWKLNLLVTLLFRDREFQ